MKSVADSRPESRASWLYRRLNRKWDDWRVQLLFRGRVVHEVSLDGATARFHTADPYSKRWFYPRYGDGSIHEAPVTRLMLEHVKEARCFVDVGVHLGWFTCLCASLMKDGEVHGFEMDQATLKLAQRNIALNGLKNVTLVHSAVADASGMDSYISRGQPNPGLKLTGHGSQQGKEVQVPVVSMDDYFRDRTVLPDVMKIDVEGAEGRVLAGMNELISRGNPVLFVEIHPGKIVEQGMTVAGVLKQILDWGYELAEIEAYRDAGSLRTLRGPTDSLSDQKANMVLATRTKN